MIKVKIFLIILSVFAVSLTTLLCIKIKIRFRINHLSDKNDKVNIRVFAYSEKIGFSLPRTKKINKKGKRNEKSKSKEKEKETGGIVERLYNIYENFVKLKFTHLLCRDFIRKRVRIENLCVKVDFGLSDAAKTGIATGAVWGILYNIFGFVTRFFYVENHKFDVNADYNKEKFELDVDGILSFRIVNIIIIACYALLKYMGVSKKFEQRFEEVV